MLKRRLRDAGLSTIYSNHSFRGAGITNYLENDGTLEVAQRIAGHADSRTTKLYDRRAQKLLLEDIERIRYWLRFSHGNTGNRMTDAIRAETD
jgi:site-specific recombinase XerD